MLYVGKFAFPRFRWFFLLLARGVAYRSLPLRPFQVLNLPEFGLRLLSLVEEYLPLLLLPMVYVSSELVVARRHCVYVGFVYAK